MRTLIWSVAWGEYRYMLQNLMNSIRSVGIEHDILTFSDQPLSGVISCEMDKDIHLDGTQYWKFDYLTKIAKLDYDVFVFIDSDHHFVRKPRLDFHELLAGDPWHSFLESPLNNSTTSRTDWWGVQNKDMVRLWRNFGVTQNTVYNTNGGFWVCKKEFAEHARKTVLLFKEFQSKEKLNLPEEVPIGVLSHMFSIDYRKRLHENLIDIWASEWTGVLKDKLPNGSDWEFVEYMTGKKMVVNPSVVHAMRSKNALVQSGHQIFEKTKDERKFMIWEEVLSLVNSATPKIKNTNDNSIIISNVDKNKKAPSSSSSKKDCGCGRKKKSAGVSPSDLSPVLPPALPVPSAALPAPPESEPLQEVEVITAQSGLQGTSIVDVVESLKEVVSVPSRITKRSSSRVKKIKSIS